MGVEESGGRLSRRALKAIMTSLVEIDLTCPICDTRFTSRRIASMESIGQDTDFRPRTLGIDPQPHYVHVCPNCMFAAFELDYETLQDPVREFVEGGQHHPEELVIRGDPLTLTGSVKYLLAARCYSRDTRAGDLRLADLYLRASWCARQEGLTEREQETQCEAALLFEKSLEDDEIAEDQLSTILYLLGELYRRIGRHELATTMFDKALEHCGDDEADERLSFLIERQRHAAEAGNCDNMEIEDE